MERSLNNNRIFRFRALLGCTELWLMLLWFAWLIVTRIINGDTGLTIERNYIIKHLAMVFLFLPVGIVLNKKWRGRVLDLACIVLCGAYTLVGIACIYAYIMRISPMLPVLNIPLCTFSKSGLQRLHVFGKNSNICACWYFFCFWLSVYQMLKRKNRCLRLLLCFAAIVCFTVVALTHSRNTMLSFAVCLGMLAVLFALKRIPLKKLLHKAVLILLVMSLVTPLAYKSFDLASGAVSAVTAEAEEDADISYTDERGFYHSGRLRIYKSFIPTMKQEPRRMLVGSLWDDVMDISETVVHRRFAHFHCMYLQVFALTGLPGFIIMMAFLLLLAIKAVRLYFSPSVDMAIKSLVIPVTGILLYNVLDVSLFWMTEIRQPMFFFTAGMVIAYANELCGKKEER